MIETSPLRYILMTKRFMQIASQVNNTCSLFTAYMHGFIVYLGYIQQFLFLKDLLFTSKIHIHIHFNTNSLVVSNSLRYDELLFQLRIEKCERWNNYVMILRMGILTQIMYVAVHVYRLSINIKLFLCSFHRMTRMCIYWARFLILSTPSLERTKKNFCQCLNNFSTILSSYW